jgi:iron complex outermembrane recepter protein
MARSGRWAYGIGIALAVEVWAPAFCDSELQEVVVTAQKYVESVNDVGASITVLSANVLQQQRIMTGEDLAVAVPGLTYARSDYNTPIFSLRGIGFNDVGLGVFPAVSFYVDEAPLVFPVLAANTSFDLERIEVLKGPQGTLFGLNSTGGALNLIAKKPTNSFEAGTVMTYGRFNLNEYEGYLSGPISETLRVRVSGLAHFMDPWQISYTRGDRNGRENVIAGRVIVDMQPSSAWNASFTLGAWRDESQPLAMALIGTKWSSQYSRTLSTPDGSPILEQPLIPPDPLLADWGGPAGPPNNPFVAAATPTRLFADGNLLRGTLRVEYQAAESLRFISLTSAIHFDQTEGLSRSGSAIQNEDITNLDGSIRNLSEEVRLENAGSGDSHWIIGANYEHDDVTEDALFSYVNNTVAIGTNIFQNTINQWSAIEDWAGFANLERGITEHLKLNIGTRYTATSYNFNSCNTDAGDGHVRDLFNDLGTLLGKVPFTPIGTGPGQCFPLNYQDVPGQVFSDTLKESNTSWRLGADYHVAGDLLYASIAKGYKQGSFPFSSPGSWAGFQPARQESVLAYETGVKSELLGRRLALNSALFYYDYTNKQVRGSVYDPVFDILPHLVNVPKSRIEGAEFELATTPIPELRLSASSVYLDSRITKISPTAYDVAGQQLNMVGAPLPLTPKWSYKIAGELSREVQRVKPFVAADFRWEDKADANLDGSNVTVASVSPGTPANLILPGYSHPFVIDSYGILSLQLGVAGADDRWSAYLWCENCANKYYWLNVTVAQDNISREVGRPLSFGVTVDYRF